MKRWTLDEIREALAALARDSGVPSLSLYVEGEGSHAELRVSGPDGLGWAQHGPYGWLALQGDQDPIDRVLGRGEYQP